MTSPAVLFCANALVPGPSAISARLRTYLDALRSPLRIDALTIRFTDEGHIERHGIARHMRVKVPKDIAQREQAFGRAIKRQCESEAYAMVVAFDEVSAKAALSLKSQFGFEVLLDRIEASPRARRKDDEKLFKSLDGVIVSRPPESNFERAEEGLHYIERSVDESVFMPPTMEVAHERPKLVIHAPAKAEERARLKPLLEGLAKFSHVTLLGPAPKMPRLKGVTHNKTNQESKRARTLQGCDLVVVVSTERETPYAALESLSCGRPCVVFAATPMTAAPLLSTHITRSYVEGAFAQAEFIATLLRDPERMTSLKERALKFAQSHEYALILKKTRRLFEELLKTGTLAEVDADEDLPFAPSQIVMLREDDAPALAMTVITARPDMTSSAENSVTEQAASGDSTQLPAAETSASLEASKMPAPPAIELPHISASAPPFVATIVSMRPLFSESESASNGPWTNNDTVADAGPFETRDTHSRDSQKTETLTESASSAALQTRPASDAKGKGSKQARDLLADALPFEEMTTKNKPAHSKTSDEA